MSSMTLTVLEMTMGGSPALRVHGSEICPQFEELERTETKPLRANWVVECDEGGKREVRMRWTVGRKEATRIG